VNYAWDVPSRLTHAIVRLELRDVMAHGGLFGAHVCEDYSAMLLVLESKSELLELI